MIGKFMIRFMISGKVAMISTKLAINKRCGMLEMIGRAKM